MLDYPFICSYKNVCMNECYLDMTVSEYPCVGTRFNATLIFYEMGDINRFTL